MNQDIAFQVTKGAKLDEGKIAQILRAEEVTLEKIASTTDYTL